MRLVQLEGPPNEAPLSFHPRVTVVGGLDDDRRAQMVATLRALPAGTDPGWEGLVEAHGIVLDLHRDNLRLLGLQHDVDVVVGPGDLPAEGETSDRSAGAVTPSAAEDHVEGLRLSHDILAHGVAALKRSRIEFEEARLQAVEAIEEARADLDPFATTAFEQAAAQLRRAADNATGPGATPVITESLPDLEAARDRLQADLAQMDAVDLQPVRDALHRAERVAGAAGDGLDPVAVRALVTALVGAEQALADLDGVRREQGRDPADLFRRIEGARIQLERLETSAAPPTISSEDRVELEAAHDAVLDADAKVSASRIGGKAARQHFDEVVAAEQAILDRMGFTTYSSFALAQSAPGPDPETRVELEATRRELTELESAYHAALASGEGDAERAELEAQRDALRRDAAALVDAEPDHVLAAVSRLADELSGDARRLTASSELRDRLAERGVDFGDLDLTDDEVVEVARVWLSDMSELAESRDELEHELDTVRARLLVVTSAIAQGEAAADPLTRAQAEVEAAEARLARHRQASDRVAELCGLLEEIEGRLASLGENIGAQEDLVAAAAEGMATTEERLAAGPEAGDVDEAGAALDDLLLGMTEVDDTEWYLLTRLAGLRALSFAGSVPLVLDGALADLDREAAHRVLDKVEAMTDVVQVIYLGDDDAVVEWAALRGSEATVITATSGETAPPYAAPPEAAAPVAVPVA
ncbi:MAG TPA: hypothetical protein VIT01_05530 [Acidimicrobiales bacterium]